MGDDLTKLPGIGPASAEKLESSGFDTYLAIAVTSPAALSEVTGLSEAVARKVIQNARDSMKMGFESGDALLERRSKVLKITTSSTNLDNVLDGGVETSAITECFGQYGSSKTQIAHQLAVNVQLPFEQGGAEGIAVYIDTENTFRPERIKQMAEGLGLDYTQTLRNIKVAKAYNSDHQMLLVQKISDLINEDELNVKVVIVDSLTSHFRSEYVGRGTLADRQQKLNKHMHDLAKLADMYNLCVYVTNQVMAKPDQFFGDPTEAIGGNVVGHNSTFRIYLRKGKKGSRVAKLVDSPNLPDNEAIFFINNCGVRDEFLD